MIGRDPVTCIVEQQTYGTLLECGVAANNERSLHSIVDGIEGLHRQFSAVWHGLNSICYQIEDHTVESSLISGDGGSCAARSILNTIRFPERLGAIKPSTPRMTLFRSTAPDCTCNRVDSRIW